MTEVRKGGMCYPEVNMQDKPLSARLRRQRVARGHQITEAAAAMGVHPHTVHRWERDLKKPKPYHYAVLAEYLGEDLDNLMDELEG